MAATPKIVTSKPGPAPLPQESVVVATDGYPRPVFRCLRGYALDPSLRTHLETVPISTIVFKVPWEPLAPGPVGEYLEVIDYDPASACCYQPVNLEDPRLLAQEGFAPSEGVPQFHQQTVYAVASLTIRHFERALGRKALWRPKGNPNNPHDDSQYVPKLRIYPHALREANAYYSPEKIALLFGYYVASDDDPADHLPGGTVFTCLSRDVTAHETTHALLDGMHRSFIEPTNPDMQAFHEAFADIVAMFQHFTHPELVQHQVAQTRGDLHGQENLLGQLASEFGRTTGKRTALRDAIGKYNQETNHWEPKEPDPKDYEEAQEPHERGAVLVAAVFDAFLKIYENRTRDLLRLASGGTGVLALGALHPDLVNRLSEEVCKAANHVLGMCIRALDYCPPVDLTFGEYLRALITADHDLVEDDDLHYRVAFTEAFRHRGIFPRNLRSLSEESLLWRGPAQDGYALSKHLLRGIESLRPFADKLLYTDSREEVFRLSREMRIQIHGWLSDHFGNGPEGARDAENLGLQPGRKLEVRSARVANRIGPDGNILPQFVIELLQERPAGRARSEFTFKGGCTLIADLRSSEIRYCIRKDTGSPTREEREARFRAARPLSLRETYFQSVFQSVNQREPLAMLHRG